MPPLVTLGEYRGAASEKENSAEPVTDGLKNLFNKQKGKRRKSSSGLRMVQAENGKRAALPLVDMPDKPAAGSPVRSSLAAAPESTSPTAGLINGLEALGVSDSASAAEVVAPSTAPPALCLAAAQG